MRIAIVILNWNGKFFLEKFLAGIVQHSRDLADVVVADNNSSDDSIEFLRKAFPAVKIILNKSNLGFAGGYNAALKEVDADYYILLNSDVEVTRNWISPVIEIMEKDPAVVACQPKIKSYKEKEKFEYAGGGGGFIDKYGYPFCRGRIFSTLEKDEHQYDDPSEIFWATGACMFIRSEIFHRLGGFDETFFAHMEEIDLCWRIHRAGFKIMYCPTASIYHIGGGTLPKNNANKTYLNFRNNLMMIYKNAESSRLTSILLFRTVFDFVAALQFLFTSGWLHCKAVIKAHLYFQRHRKKIHRQPNQKNNGSTAPLIYPKSILFSYFVFRKRKFSQLKNFRNKT